MEVDLFHSIFNTDNYKTQLSSGMIFKLTFWEKKAKFLSTYSVPQLSYCKLQKTWDQTLSRPTIRQKNQWERKGPGFGSARVKGTCFSTARPRHSTNIKNPTRWMEHFPKLRDSSRVIVNLPIEAGSNSAQSLLLVQGWEADAVEPLLKPPESQSTSAQLFF